jgi:hypothetical protein
MTRFEIGIGPEGRIELLPRILIMWRDEEGPIMLISIHWMNIHMAVTSFKQEDT